jgi:hypothetical protein
MLSLRCSSDSNDDGCDGDARTRLGFPQQPMEAQVEMAEMLGVGPLVRTEVLGVRLMSMWMIVKRIF